MIFIHIPKTGGSSIEKAMNYNRNHFSVLMWEFYFHPFLIFKIKKFWHIVEFFRFLRFFFVLDQIARKRKYSREKLEFVAIIRDPVSRFISFYNNVTGDKNHLKNLKIDPQISLRDFLFVMGRKGGARPQYCWISSLHPSTTVKLYKFESFQESYRSVLKDLGLDIEEIGIVFHEKKGGSHLTRNSVDPGLVSMIYEKYADELDILKISKMPF